MFGVILGVLVVLVASVPAAFANATVALTPDSVLSASASSASFTWPSAGSASAAVPLLDVTASSPHQPVAPIASLTKLMTAYVALRLMPLSPGATGPCTTVTNDDVAEYQREQHLDQSSVKVIAGTTLCEIDLLNGLFVHSANNYCLILVRLSGLSFDSYVSVMNETAQRLMMTKTTYVDVSGVDPANRSTAQDQMKLVVPLMANALVRSIVAQASVVLPAAGTVHTYTPLLGTKGVVGIKSGHTDAAGGCDAMALQVNRAGRSFLVYSVVLGQRGKDLLAAAGRAAYQVARSAAAQVVVVALVQLDRVGTVGWRSSSSDLLVMGEMWQLYWRNAPASHVTWHLNRSEIVRGDDLGDLTMAACQHCASFGAAALTAAHGVARPSWSNALR